MDALRLSVRIARAQPWRLARLRRGDGTGAELEILCVDPWRDLSDRGGGGARAPALFRLRLSLSLRRGRARAVGAASLLAGGERRAADPLSRPRFRTNVWGDGLFRSVRYSRRRLATSRGRGTRRRRGCA